MKQRNLILISSILFFATCQKITKDDLKGKWISYPIGFDEPEIFEMYFQDDQVELIDEYLFKERGKYKIENEVLKIKRNHDGFEIKTKIQKYLADTIVIFDSLKYHRNTETNTSHLEEYELMDIETNRILSKEKRLFHLIHYYKSENEKLKIRIGESKALYEDIPLFLNSGHSNPNVMLFIGKRINLFDLKRMYFQLAASGERKVWIITKRKGLSDYEYFVDEIEVWWNELEKHLSKMKSPLPPPPPIESVSKENYLKGGGENILINSKEDFKLIDSLQKKQRYVFSFNENLEFKYYVELNNKLRLLKKELEFEYKTEIE